MKLMLEQRDTSGARNQQKTLIGETGSSNPNHRFQSPSSGQGGL